MPAEWTLATWNVNSLRARQDLVLDWLRTNQPDVLCLQETKVSDEEFPTDVFARQGYMIRFSGQKSYNGVAIAARTSIDDVRLGLDDGFASPESRLISARVGGVRVVCVYVPNGKSVESPDFAKKLDWLRSLKQTLSGYCRTESELVVCGDFNIAPEERDVYDPAACAGQLLFHPDERRALEDLKQLGLEDVFRKWHPGGGLYSWWDYRAGAFRRNRGMRIDYVLATAELAARCRSAYIAKEERGKEKPSDHAPVVAMFER